MNGWAPYLAVELLVFADELRRHDRVLLLQLDRATRADDPALARRALADALYAALDVMRRHGEVAERLLAGHPTQAPTAGQPTPGRNCVGS
ncbi:hypothetical protein ACIQ9P_26460 [Kitasatospora sp. NPDC094019]|uniref:hypothetical protein n=1 Tax=Kitasatospora sp. NPDC094019 TaxID=3364091 RepID=UPI0038133364